jgi:hypothetical protein
MYDEMDRPLACLLANFGGEVSSMARGGTHSMQELQELDLSGDD